MRSGSPQTSWQSSPDQEATETVSSLLSTQTEPLRHTEMHKHQPCGGKVKTFLLWWHAGRVHMQKNMKASCHPGTFAAPFPKAFPEDVDKGTDKDLKSQFAQFTINFFSEEGSHFGLNGWDHTCRQSWSDDPNCDVCHSESKYFSE